MRSKTLILNSITTDFTTNLLPPIKLKPNRKYESALLSINLFNTIPNVTNKNNKFKYSTDNGGTWKIITLHKGAYKISSINDEIQRQMVSDGNYNAVKDEFFITI